MGKKSDKKITCGYCKDPCNQPWCSTKKDNVISFDYKGKLVYQERLENLDYVYHCDGLEFETMFELECYVDPEFLKEAKARAKKKTKRRRKKSKADKKLIEKLGPHLKEEE